MGFDRRAWAREYQARRRARRAALGLCGRCGKAAVERFRDCARCRELDRIWRLQREAEQTKSPLGVYGKVDGRTT